MHERHPTAQVVQVHDRIFLVDCGEGTQMQMSRFKIRRNKISHIFISHLHGDHYFGLAGLLSSYALNGRTEDLWLYAPAPLQQILELQFQAANAVLPYPLHFVALQGEQDLYEDKRLVISCFEVDHRVPCWGFLFREKKKPLHLVGEKLKEYAIPSSFYRQLKEGTDYITKEGFIIKNEWVTEAPSPSLSYAYCADTAYMESLAGKLKGVTLLYHETTYLAASQEKAFSRGHSTTVEAASLAAKAGVKRLLIGHYSSRYEKLDEFLEECRPVFRDTSLAIEGVTYLVS